MTATPAIPNRNLPTSPTSGNYRDIWEALKNNTSKSVRVRCNPMQRETLIQAVKKIKSTENANRKRLDLPHWGRLKIVVDSTGGVVTFSLTYSMEDFS